MDNIEIDKLRRVYEDSTLSREDTAKLFGVSMNELIGILAKHNIKKTHEARSSMIRSSQLAKENKADEAQLHELYIQQDMTIAEIAKILDLEKNDIRSALRFHGIKKSREQLRAAQAERMRALGYSSKGREITPETRELLSEASSKGGAVKAERTEADLLARGVTKESAYQYFIVENHTLGECTERFSMPYSTFRKLLKRWGIAKTQKQAAVRSKATMQERYGEEHYRNRLANTDRRLNHAKSVEARNRNTEKRLNAEGLTREYLEQEYIIKNRSFASLAEEFSISKGRMRKILSRYDLVKTPEMAEASRRGGVAKFHEDEEKVREAVARAQSTIKERYGEKWYRENASKPEAMLFEAIKGEFPSLSVIGSTYSVIRSPRTGAALQLDIYLPDIALALEFNGEYWHDKAAWERDMGRGTIESKEALKTHLCREKGILLHHLWDGEWKLDREAFIEEVIALVAERVKEMEHGSGEG